MSYFKLINLYSISEKFSSDYRKIYRARTPPPRRCVPPPQLSLQSATVAWSEIVFYEIYHFASIRAFLEERIMSVPRNRINLSLPATLFAISKRVVLSPYLIRIKQW